MNVLLARKSHLILILGMLVALCPFSIDMYLPSFPKMALQFGVEVPRLSLTLSSFFIGLAVGQLIYGPLLDHFGRKKPLYVGLAIYVVATGGCYWARSVESIVVLRFVQAMGGCAANVAAIAMVRDYFPGKDSAKVISLLILILGVSPLLAPTVGSALAAAFGWRSIFATLALIGIAMFAVTYRYLPEGREPDETHSLKPSAIVSSYFTVFKQPQFYTFAFAASFAFAGLFVYLASSPGIFMEGYRVSVAMYSWIFAFIAAGLIGVSQLNFLLLRKRTNVQVLKGSLAVFVVICAIFLGFAFRGPFSLLGLVAVFFCILASVGLANPNATALALAPFSHNAGTAAALLGFIQMCIGSLASLGVGLLKTRDLRLIAGFFAGSAVLALATLFFGSRQIRKLIDAPQDAAESAL